MSSVTNESKQLLTLQRLGTKQETYVFTECRVHPVPISLSQCLVSPVYVETLVGC